MHKELRTNIEMTCLRLGEITMVDSTYISDEAIERARRAGAESLNGPRAVAARYLADRQRIEIDLSSGWSIQVPRSFSARTANADAAACSQIEITDSGLGLRWPLLDDDWYVPAVVEALAMHQAA